MTSYILDAVLGRAAQMVGYLSSFFHALAQLLFLSHRIAEADTPAYTVVFGLSCSLISIAFIALDRGNKALRGGSLLSVDYDGASFIAIAGAWLMIAFVTGFLALSLDVLQPTFAASVAVSVSWPLILTVITGLQPTSPSSGTDTQEAEEDEDQ